MEIIATAPITTGQTVYITKGFAHHSTGEVTAVKPLVAEGNHLGWLFLVDLPGYGLRWMAEDYVEVFEV